MQVRQSLAETRDLLAVAAAHPLIAGVVGWVDLCAPVAEVEAQLQAVAHPKLVGIRHVVGCVLPLLVSLRESALNPSFALVLLSALFVRCKASPMIS